MPEENKILKKLTLADGSKVGIINLDVILKEVGALNLVDSNSIKVELVNKAAVSNYIPTGAKADYSEALFKEYRRKFGAVEGKEADKPEIHKHTPG